MKQTDDKELCPTLSLASNLFTWSNVTTKSTDYRSKGDISLVGRKKQTLSQFQAALVALIVVAIVDTSFASNERRIGAIDIGDKEPHFQQPTLLEAAKPRFRFEHGTGPGMDDEKWAEQAERMQANGEWPPPPPAWQNQLRMKLRVAQEGRYWEKGTGDTGPLGIARSDPSEHQAGLWSRVCYEMGELMDRGCGHDMQDFEKGRQRILDMMKTPDPKRNGRDILEVMEKNRRRAEDAARTKRIQELERGDIASEDCCSEEEQLLNELRERRREAMREEVREKEMRLREVVEVSAHTFAKHVLHAGERVWVVAHVFDFKRQDCTVLHEVCQDLARKYGGVAKFVRIHYTHVLPDLDQATELPQVLVYRNGQIKHQVTGLLDLGSASVGIEGRILDTHGKDPRAQIADGLQSLLGSLGVLVRHKDPTMHARTDNGAASSNQRGALSEEDLSSSRSAVGDYEDWSLDLSVSS